MKKKVSNRYLAGAIEDVRQEKDFARILLLQESILIWILTITYIVLAFVCVCKNYLGELPWLTAMVSLPWAAYGVSQACYYKKTEKENVKDGIKYETIMRGFDIDEDEEAQG